MTRVVRKWPARRGDRGFVLVGVVMFVLALTILGLSLFALSGYEAQFMTQSFDSSQALYSAQSGIENAKFVLAHRRRLEDVGTWLYPNDVVYARASYLKSDGTRDSIKNLDELPESTSVEIRVLANVHGERRMLQTTVISTQSPEVYKRLMSVPDSMYAGGPHDGGLRDHGVLVGTGPRTVLTGEVFEGGESNSSWWNDAVASPPTISRGLPVPNVQAFFDRHLNDPMTLVTAKPDTFWSFLTPGQLDLNGVRGSGTVTYFRTETDPFGSPLWSLKVPQFSDHKPGNLEVNVKGWVVWMLPHGLRVESKMTIKGSSSTDCLVIVAGPTLGWNAEDLADNLGRHGRQGIMFRAAIASTNVPVILVSNGWVIDTHTNYEYWFGEDISYLSVFARCVAVQGPPDYSGTPGNYTRLTHSTSSPFDLQGGLIDRLCALGALPNSESGAVSFKSVPGTWVELDPDNPPN